MRGNRPKDERPALQRTIELKHDNTGLLQEIAELRRAENELKTAHRELAARTAQLRALAGEMVLAEQRKRRKMAETLHDHLQQLLVGAKFRAAILGRAGDELVRKEAKEIEDLLDDSISASRSFTAELNPPVLHEGGLLPGLKWLARWMADNHDLHVELSMETMSPPIGEDVKILLFESVRELLFNTAKHSHMRSATVNVRVEDDQLEIVVADQGVGFEPESVKPAGQPGGGFGLFSIRERLDLLGGMMKIESAPGKGSRFVLTAPLGHPLPNAPEPVAVNHSTRSGPSTGLVTSIHGCSYKPVKRSSSRGKQGKKARSTKPPRKR